MRTPERDPLASCGPLVQSEVRAGQGHSQGQQGPSCGLSEASSPVEAASTHACLPELLRPCHTNDRPLPILRHG